MRTVAAFEVRSPATRGNKAKLTARPPRGAIGAGLFLLVSGFLLAAGGVPTLPAPGSAAPASASAFVLDPAVAAAAS